MLLMSFKKAVTTTSPENKALEPNCTLVPLGDLCIDPITEYMGSLIWWSTEWKIYKVPGTIKEVGYPT